MQPPNPNIDFSPAESGGGTLNHGRDGAFANEVDPDHHVGNQGFEVSNYNITHTNGHSSSGVGMDMPDNFYEDEGGEGESEVDNGSGPVEVILGARRIIRTSSIATMSMFYPSKKRTKAIVGIGLLIFVVIFFVGIGGIVNHNKEVAAMNSLVQSADPEVEECPSSKSKSSSSSSKSKSKNGSKSSPSSKSKNSGSGKSSTSSSKSKNSDGRHLISWRGKNGEFEAKHVPVHLRMNAVKGADTNERILVSTMQK